MQTRRKEITESQRQAPPLGSRSSRTAQPGRGRHLEQSSATVHRVSSNDNTAVALVESAGKKVQRRKSSTAERIAEIDERLEAMTPSEYAKDKAWKAARRRVMRRGITATEHQEQVRVVDWAAHHESRWPELALLFAIPNGGHRRKAVAAKLKAEGVKAGVPDMCLPVARGPYHGLYIELKTLTGSATKEQRAWLQSLTEQGYCARLARGADMAIHFLEWYLTGCQEPEL